MQAKKMLLLVIIILILWIGLWIFIWSKNIVSLSKNLDKNTTTIVKKPSNTLAWTWNTWTWGQVDIPMISYQDKKWTKIFTNEDDFLTWFIESWKSYNDIGNWINENGIWSNIAGLNLSYILYNDFTNSLSNWRFKSFFNRNGVMALMVLLNKERNINDIKRLVPNVFEILYQEKGDQFITSQNKVLGTTGLLKDELKDRSLEYAVSRMKELSVNGYLKTDFDKIGFYNPVEIALQNLDINWMITLCKKGVSNNEYDLSYCMDFIYLYLSSEKNTYSDKIKNNFMRYLTESYNKYGLKKVWE